MLGTEDGPSKVILDYMLRYKNEVPKDWPQYRNIDFKYPPISTDFMQDDNDEAEGGEGQNNEDDEDSDD
jgi:hypothetical protein